MTRTATTYRAIAEWDGYAWAATVVGQDHVFTQAKRLEQLPTRLSEVMRLMTGKRVAPGKWELDIRYDKLTDEAAQLKKMRAEVEEAEAQLAARTAKIARALRR